MYVATFYSFKGGVGRTLALVNCAFELAKRRKRVLLVDFDLEAPGLSSFAPFSRAAHCPGLVDYVTQFVATGEAPDAGKFLYRCNAEEHDQGALWVMPAGRQDSGYGARLASLDWNDLYERHEGFLMFEDLKAQWKEVAQPDYVLIDSRTGHTDVGGICTRQLPDAVTLLFFPNEQNIAGLSAVVRAVRDEQRRRGTPITLHFVPSNVPHLDDEDGTLQGWIERSKNDLEYRNPSAVIHHYDSMALLDQLVFTAARPRSRLSREYRELVDALVSNNLEDRDGALTTLDRLRTQLSLNLPGPHDEGRHIDLDKLQTIGKHHQKDGEILFRMGLIREQTGDATAALLALNAAVEVGHAAPRVYLARAAAYRALAENDKATEDLLAVLRSSSASHNDVLRAVYGLREMNPDRIRPDIVELAAFANLPVSSFPSLASATLVSRPGAAVSEIFCKRVLADAGATEDDRMTAGTTLALSFIARQKFADALTLLTPDATRDDAAIPDLFNFAVAAWGKNGKPERELFERVIARHLETPGQFETANYFQAMALALTCVGNREHASDMLTVARDALLANPRTEFSAWRYLEVPPHLFLEDLDAMRTWIAEERGQPAFLGDPMFSWAN